MTDKQIIEKLFARSEEALEALSRRFRGLCMSISRAILGSSEDAEECFNDTLLQVWDSIPPDRPDNLTAYVAKIDRNIALNRLNRDRAQKRGGGQYEEAFEELDECLSDSGDTEREVVDRMALKAALDAFLSSLPDRQKEIFLRRYFSFESTASIAKDLGVKESALRMTLLRLRESLKEYLSRENIEL